MILRPASEPGCATMRRLRASFCIFCVFSAASLRASSPRRPRRWCGRPSFSSTLRCASHCACLMLQYTLFLTRSSASAAAASACAARALTKASTARARTQRRTNRRSSETCGSTRRQHHQQHGAWGREEWRQGKVAPIPPLEKEAAGWVARTSMSPPYMACNTSSSSSRASACSASISRARCTALSTSAAEYSVIRRSSV